MSKSISNPFTVIQPKAWEIYYSSEKYPRGNRYVTAFTEKEKQDTVRAFKLLDWQMRVVPVYGRKS